MRHVYVAAGDTGPDKVGCSTNLPSRELALQFYHKGEGSLKIVAAFAVGDKAILVERLAHLALWPHRTKGEWFDVSTEAAVKAITNAIMIAQREDAPLGPHTRSLLIANSNPCA